MSIRVDSAQLIPGSIVVGGVGLGVPASSIPSTGDSGPGYLFNDIAEQGAAPTDEMRGEILTWPSAGTLTANEDSSFSFTGAPDGVYTATYRGYKNGVSYNNPDEAGGEWIITMTIGSEAPSNSQATVSATFNQFSAAVAASSIDPLGSSAVVAATFSQFSTEVSAGTLYALDSSASVSVTFGQFSANVSAGASGEPLNSDAAVAVSFPQFTASVIANNGQVVYYTDPKAILTKTFKSSILFKI